MKVSIHTVDTAEETEIVITCKHITSEIERVMTLLRTMGKELSGKKDGETFLVPADQVLYIDTADKRTFLYTGEAVYETGMKLYELEELLSDTEFFRAGKSCIVNWRQIVSIKADLDRRLLVTMSNGEKLVVSRQYADHVRVRLGVR